MHSPAVLIKCGSCGTLNRLPADRLRESARCGQCKTPLTFPVQPVRTSLATFDRELAEWPETVLAEFRAKWCGYCRMLDPVVNDIAQWRAGKLKVLQIDVDEEPLLARRFAIRATPTFILFRGGTQIARMEGATREKIDLLRWVDSSVGA
jgi:thioredoxin 2